MARRRTIHLGTVRSPEGSYAYLDRTMKAQARHEGSSLALLLVVAVAAIIVLALKPS